MATAWPMEPSHKCSLAGASLFCLPERRSPIRPRSELLWGGLSGSAWNVLSGTNNFITYDQRGVIDTGAAVYVLYLGNPNDANSGYRAIITMPSGAVQVWTSSSAGNWQRIS